MTLAIRRREVAASFWTDERVIEVSDAAKLFFIGLWAMADREGRLEDRPLMIGMRIRAWDARAAPSLVDELVGAGLVSRYEAGGQKCIAIPRFRKYQRPHPHEARSTLPAPITPPTEPPKQENVITSHDIEITSETTAQTTCSDGDVTECASNVGLSLSEPSEPSEPSKKETSVEFKIRPVALAVFDHWRTVMKHQAAKFVGKRQRAVYARIREGYTQANLCAAVDGCAQTAHNMGQNDRHERYDDLELICRDGAHVERFMRKASDWAENDDARICAACGAAASAEVADGLRCCYPCIDKFREYAASSDEPWLLAAHWVKLQNAERRTA